MKGLLAAGMALGFAATAVLAQEEPQRSFDLIFRGGTLDALPVGAELDYQGETTFGLTPSGIEHVSVELREEDTTTISRQSEGDSARPLGSFSTSTGNPLAMFFLERTVRTISEATGGGQTYIRNRIREALAGPGEVEEVTVSWQGREVPATRVTLAPFVNDPNRSRLGAFADLRLEVTVSQEVPGWYHSLSATTPGHGTGKGGHAELNLAEVSR